MIKSGRKPSSDPIQEKLRLEKATWNKGVSSFVNDLIHLKKMMNGWPSKFHMEKSFIKDPIPADPATIIGSLAGEFQDIAQKGNKIVQQQLDYSKSRRKRQMKQLNLPTPATPTTPAAPAAPATPDLSQQLSLPVSAGHYFDLISEGSNPISRFFTRLLTPTIGISEAARVRKYRMSLLSSCLKTYKDLGKLQVEIVKSSKDSINNSNKILHQTWNDWSLVSRAFFIYRSNMPETIENAGGELNKSKERDKEKSKDDIINPTPSVNTLIPGDFEHDPSKAEIDRLEPSHPVEFNSQEIISLASAAIKDYSTVIRKKNINLLIPDINVLRHFIDVAGKFKMPSKNKLQDAQAVVKSYRALVDVLNIFHSTNSSSLEQMLSDVVMKLESKIPVKKTTADLNIEKQQIYSIQMEKVAQDFLKKWFGKTRHQLSMFDKTSAYRLDIYKMCGEMRKIIDQIMDSLEKDMKVDDLEPMINQINRNMTSLRGFMRAIHYSDKTNYPETTKNVDK